MGNGEHTDTNLHRHTSQKTQTVEIKNNVSTFARYPSQRDPDLFSHREIFVGVVV